MGTLIFVCPTTGLEVFTGLEMDHNSFATLPSVYRTFAVPTAPNHINYPK